MSGGRLTDEQVERMVAAPAVVWGQAAAEMLAREVQACRALRPDCPTCHGDKVVRPFSTGNPCPDCTDGKMPLDKWVALLVDTLRDATVQTMRVRAVLKMVPK